MKPDIVIMFALMRLVIRLSSFSNKVTCHEGFNNYLIIKIIEPSFETAS